MESKHRKAALYIRVSTEEQAKEGFSVPAQTETLTQYCKIFGIQIYNTYTDAGISGKNTERPQLQKMLKDAHDKKFDCLLVWKISRLSRSLKDLLCIMDQLEKCGVSFISYSEQFDTSTAVGKMTVQLLGSIAEFERNTMIENVKLGLEQRAKQGGWTGNHILGYDNINKELIINEEEAIIVRRIFDMYLNQSLGFFAIANKLNREGIKTKRNAHFGKDYIERILKNPVYTGKVRHNLRNDKGYYEVCGKHQPIISQEIFDAVQKKSEKRSVRFVREPNNFLLVGMLKCKICGAGVVSKYGYYKGKKYRYYICSNYHRLGKSACSPNPIQADEIESTILKRLFELVDNPEIIENIVKNTLDKSSSNVEPLEKELFAITQEIETQTRNINNYFKMFENSKIKPELLENRIETVQNTLNDLNRRKNEIEFILHNHTGISISEQEVIEVLKNFREVFNCANDLGKRMLLQSFIDEIHLNEDGSLKNISTKFPVGPEYIAL